jgi:hypothetical protein
MVGQRWSHWWQRCQRPLARRSRRTHFRRLALEELESRWLLSAGNTLSSAISVPVSTVQTGYLQPATYYALSVTQSGRLTAQVTPQGGDSRLSLLSSSGQVLVQSDGQSGSNPTDRLDVHLTGSTSGTQYFLEIQGVGLSLLPQEDDILDQLSRWTAGVEAWAVLSLVKPTRQDEPSASDEAVRDALFAQCPSACPTEQPRLQALAICAASMYLVRERSSRTAREQSPGILPDRAR